MSLSFPDSGDVIVTVQHRSKTFCYRLTEWYNGREWEPVAGVYTPDHGKHDDQPTLFKS